MSQNSDDRGVVAIKCPSCAAELNRIIEVDPIESVRHFYSAALGGQVRTMAVKSGGRRERFVCPSCRTAILWRFRGVLQAFERAGKESEILSAVRETDPRVVPIWGTEYPC